MKKALIINSNDNVAVILEETKKGECIELLGPNLKCSIISNEKIPFAHKIALKDINEGEDVVKYGEKIGYATKKINKGDWIHIHNINCERGRKTI